jgi:hypothetical protein
MKKLFALCVLNLMVVGGCGDSSSGSDDNDSAPRPLGKNAPLGSPSDFEKNSNTTTQSYTYSFDSNGCKTGKQEFKSLSSMCTGLLDDKLNKGCARAMRVELHDKKC